MALLGLLRSWVRLTAPGSPAAGLATKAAQKATSPGASAAKDWDAVTLPESVTSALPTTVRGQSFAGDLRSTSGQGRGDGLTTHTSKWLQGSDKSPMEWISEAEPIKVTGFVVASHGSDDPALGCPVEYIDLRGTTYERPAVCKYTGNKFYSDSWKSGGGHH